MMIIEAKPELIRTWQELLEEHVEEKQAEIRGAAEVWIGVLEDMDRDDLLNEGIGLELPEEGPADPTDLLRQIEEKRPIISMAMVQLANQMKQKGQESVGKHLFLTTKLISVSRRLTEAKESLEGNAISHALLQKISTLFKQGAPVFVIYNEDMELPQDILEMPPGDVVKV